MKDRQFEGESKCACERVCVVFAGMRKGFSAPSAGKSGPLSSGDIPPLSPRPPPSLPAAAAPDYRDLLLASNPFLPSSIPRLRQTWVLGFGQAYPRLN